jgi:hypothetical protein
MKALLVVFLSSFVTIAHAARDARCECSEYWPGGYTFWCEGQKIHFIPDKQAGSHSAAKDACEKAQVDFLKMETRIVCADPKGSATKAVLTFNNQAGKLAVTYPDGHEQGFAVGPTVVTQSGVFFNKHYTYEFAAYSAAMLILDVNPRFWTDDMSNTDHFEGYGAKLGLGIDVNLTCDLFDLL